MIIVSGEESFLGFIFATKIVGGEIATDPSEILDAKWFSWEEILAMRDQLRSPDLLIGAIENHRSGIVADMGVVRAIN